MMYVQFMAKKKNVHILMNESGVTIIDNIADDFQVTRSDVMRACFVVALAHEKELNERLKVMSETK